MIINITLLAFIIINLLVVFAVKKRTSIVIALIISHLLLLFFFSLTITNYLYFKQISLALIIYSMTVLFLISNYNNFYLMAGRSHKTEKLKVKSSVFPAIIFMAAGAIVFCAFFFMVKDLSQIAAASQNKALNGQNKVTKNQLTATFEQFNAKQSAESAATQRIGDKKAEFQILDKNYLAISGRQKMQLKNNLYDNFLFKYYAGLILIIVAINSVLVLLK
jgi:hypothetical protein